ncbi:dTDP-4-dehydrorhamnose 3,5-epimerase family protein [Bacillus gaemokensis]|uniref:dTDP-4-dehydrorhamnose 3,5-epimerase n=1 Tax=Bacillus gaemokensis TaxID=574375 RepID=A0A073KH40_9BACI|nr:dTDP-4-dehydrorhamnose 3,5-epimerase family protein [Bacillus gaemokensis]KEK21638.1 hypothetical protein BAGA_27565 [Bacillus gaemokensis]KYG33978.1 hypothetical protein AZF08_26880 [Bacillus gaemokensis]
MNEKNIENLPHGVKKLFLNQIKDTRGSLMEIYRIQWSGDVLPAVQWNVSISHPGTFRGFQVHWEHYDLLCVISGKLHLGLQDMRPWSPTFEMATLTILDTSEPTLVYIPPGVGHGFWFDKETTHLSGLTHYWNTRDELVCRWDDSQIKIPWPFIKPTLMSEKDQKAGTFEQMQVNLLTHLFPPTI